MSLAGGRCTRDASEACVDAADDRVKFRAKVCLIRLAWLLTQRRAFIVISTVAPLVIKTALDITGGAACHCCFCIPFRAVLRCDSSRVPMGRGRQDWMLCRFNPDWMMSLVTKSRLQFSLDARTQAPNERIRKTGLQTLQSFGFSATMI